MAATHPLEPNPVPGRRLTKGFFDDFAGYLEGQAGFGRGYGLLPPDGSGATVLPVLEPPNLLRLPALRAIGMRGFPLVAGEGAQGEIRPLDLGALPEGVYRVFACLEHEKVPCGDVFEDATSDAPASVTRGRLFRRPRIVLETEERRLAHKDWLQVARVERCRAGSARSTVLDPGFHPPILDLRAWARPNPLLLLAKRALAGLPPASSDGLIEMIRVELRVLENLAETAPPAVAFAQAQRCLGLLRAFPGRPIAVDGRLEGFAFSQETFCEFLSELSRDLQEGGEERFPALLEIDGVSYQKAGPPLQEEDGFWSWKPSRENFVANALAVYLPAATASELPVLHYSPTRNQPGNFKVATYAKRVSSRGAAAVLGGHSGPVRTLYLTVASVDLLQRMRQYLGNGHAVYYC